jgi:hypothetical protein
MSAEPVIPILAGSPGAPHPHPTAASRTDRDKNGESEAPTGETIQSNPSEQPEQGKRTPENPISEAIATLIHKLRDFEDCAMEFTPVAVQRKTDSSNQLLNGLKDAVSLMRSTDQQSKLKGIRQALEWGRKADRLIYANHERVLLESLFIGMFSAFDAYTGDLLRALFVKKPVLFNSLKRQVDITAIMESVTLDDSKRCLIEEEIETFRRDSYVDQFARLESLFGIKLRGFPRWSDFIERSQRRNLLTHCDGIVNDQYLKTCAAAGAKCDVLSGARLGVSLDCLKDTVELLMEVGIKLGQTLWRKVLPEEMEGADKSLTAEIYDRLCDENWNRAFILSRFATELPEVSNDVHGKIFMVNHIIAAKFGGQPDKAKELLETLDWSGASSEFRLAKAVLEDRFEAACVIMQELGKSGLFVSEHSYHVFPVFRVFRLQECFLKTYEKVFGHPFSEKIEQTAGETKQQLEQSADGVESQARESRAIQSGLESVAI